ncbi:hypothetical protein [Parasphingopyxis sp.]|uniref:hypothetical protein n=1 Tax=Parasphingopyxis sp. TaxID=1920299 RepID=UPI002621EEDE|nr:hypothetical protein [Parasphingopyxis sp.]
MTGFVKLHRGWRDSPIFRGKFSRGEAWLWLLENACWKDTQFDINGKTVMLRRGQLVTSRAKLAGAWGWSGSAVERFLTRLKTEQMIEQETGQGRSVITITNYRKYQDRESETGQEGEQETGQRPDSDRTAKEEREEKKEDKNNNDYAFFGRVIKLTPIDFGKWEKAYDRLDLRAALQSRDDWLASEADPSLRKKWFVSTSNWLAKKQQEGFGGEEMGEFASV